MYKEIDEPEGNEAGKYLCAQREIACSTTAARAPIPDAGDEPDEDVEENDECIEWTSIGLEICWRSPR